MDLYSALTWNTSKALRYGTRSQGISQFYLHTPRSSANRMNHTCLCLPGRSWYSFTDPGGMEGWVGLVVRRFPLLTVRFFQRHVIGDYTRVFEYSISYSTEYSSTKLLDSAALVASRIKGRLILRLLNSEILTLTRWRSFASMTVPWKNSTCVKCRLNKPSSSKSGSFLQHSVHISHDQCTRRQLLQRVKKQSSALDRSKSPVQV